MQNRSHNALTRQAGVAVPSLPQPSPKPQTSSPTVWNAIDQNIGQPSRMRGRRLVHPAALSFQKGVDRAPPNDRMSCTNRDVRVWLNCVEPDSRVIPSFSHSLCEHPVRKPVCTPDHVRGQAFGRSCSRPACGARHPDAALCAEIAKGGIQAIIATVILSRRVSATGSECGDGILDVIATCAIRTACECGTSLRLDRP